MAPAPPTIELTRPSWVWIALIGLVVFVLPPLTVVGLGRRLIHEEEVRRTAALEQALLADLRRHLAGVTPEQCLERAIDKAIRRLQWSGTSHGRRLIPSRGQPSPLPPRRTLARVRAALHREIPAIPLAVWVVGADGQTPAAWGNPRFFPRASPFPDTAVRHLMTSWFRVAERRAWGDPLRHDQFRQRVATPVGLQSFRDQCRKMGTPLFGEYLPLDLEPGPPTGFFCARFGLGRIWMIGRGRFAGEGADAPFLGGFVAFFRQADLPSSFFLAGVQRARQAAVITRRQNGLPRFIHTTRRLYAVAPLPPGLQPTLRPGADTFSQDGPVRMICVWRSRDEAESPWRSSLARGEVVLALWAIFGSLFLASLARGLVTLPLSIRGQLALAMAVAVVPPALACGLVARSVLAMWALDGERHARERLRQDLQLLESGLSGFSSEVRQRLWLEKEALAALLPRADSPTVERHLQRILEAGLAQNLHLFRHDGQEWVVQAKTRGVSPLPAETIGKMTAFARLLAGRLFIEYNPRSWERDRDAARAKGPGATRINLWSRDQLSISAAMWSHEAMGTYLGRDPIFLDARAAGFSQGTVMAFLLWKPGAPVGERLGGVLFASQPFSALGPGYFLSRLTEAFPVPSPLPGAQVHLAIFPCEREGQEGLFRLRLEPCWPPDASRDPGLVRLARQATANPWSPLPLQPDGGLAVARVFHAFPFMAVVRTTPPRGWSKTASGLLLGGGIGYLTLLIWLASRFLERIFLLPMESLVQASRMVAIGEYAPALDLPEMAEFTQLGSEFRQMCKGLREGRLLTRFVSTEVVRDSRAASTTAFEPGGERRMVAILFSHIQGFAEATRHLEAGQVFTWLNQYLSAMEAPIRAQGGAIDKYIGDAIMAVFHERTDAEAPATRAWRAACGMRRALRNLNLRRQALGHPPWRAGIGLTAGVAVSGRIGSRRRRLDFTVIGDAVNLAARLEALRAQADPEAIIVDLATARTLGHPGGGQPLGSLAIKGKAQPVEVVALPPESRPPEPLPPEGRP